MPGTRFNVLPSCKCFTDMILISMMTEQDRGCYHLHLPDKETNGQRLNDLTKNSSLVNGKSGTDNQV